MTGAVPDTTLDAIAADVDALTHVAIFLPLPVEPDDELVSALAPWLAEEDRQRIEEMSSPRTAAAFVVTRALLRRVLGRLVGGPGNEIELATSERGKPSLVPRPEVPLHFNVSHSRSHALVGLSRIGDVGIDVETIGDYRDAVARRSTTDSEYAMLGRMSEAERTAAFYRLWTIKEACAKATGHGIGVGMSNIPATLEGKGRWGDFVWASIDLGPTVAAAIAIREPAGRELRLNGATHITTLDWLIAGRP